MNRMQQLLGYTRRCVDTYQMIQPDDNIAVGVSGGKDSVTLLMVLAALRRFYPNPFRLVAITLDMGFGGMDFAPVEALCRDLDVPFVLEKTDIAPVIFDIRKEKNPCALCAKMRRGALHEAALRSGCRKVALGHHHDDVLETFLLCLFNESRISCFSPVTYLDRRDITLIRPLLYVPEAEIKRFAAEENIPVVHNPCPADGHTQREDMKTLLHTLAQERPGLRERMFRAVEHSAIPGWLGGGSTQKEVVSHEK